MAMARLLKEGKIRAIGVSNFSPAQMAAFGKVAPIHAVQPPYYLFERAIEADVLPYARKPIADPIGPEFIAPPAHAEGRDAA
jgi:aryl-alcohol dehydrogenase-like predicted oxidoreductase